MRDVFLCGPTRGSKVGDYPIKVGTFPNVFASRSKVKTHNETLIVKTKAKREEDIPVIKHTEVNCAP